MILRPKRRSLADAFDCIAELPDDMIDAIEQMDDLPPEEREGSSGGPYRDLIVAPRYLLDTNICIYIRRERPPEVRRRLARQRSDSVGLSLITWGELLCGAARSQHVAVARKKLVGLAEMIPVLPLPVAAAQHYGDIRAALTAAGMPIGANDLWIAAHARAAGLTVVTHIRIWRLPMYCNRFRVGQSVDQPADHRRGRRKRA